MNIFYEQDDDNTCGIAAIRTVLENNFGIKKTEDSLIALAEEIYLEKCSGILRQKEYEIRKYGTDVYHFKNLAEHFGLKTFTKLQGEIKNLKTLIDNKFWPIVHRKFEEDHETHFIITHNYNHSMHIFNPAAGYGLGKENYNLFDEKWLFKNQKWFIFLYKDKFKVPFKGKYL